MKIAFLSFYSGVVARGVETFVHEVANRLVDCGNEVVVYQFGSEIGGAKYKTKIIKIKMDWSKKSSLIPFMNYYGLRVGQFTKKVLKDIDVDFDIIFSTNGQWQSLLCSFWAKKNCKKIIISGQSGPGLDDRLNLYAFPDVFVALTDYQKKWAERINPFIKISKIPNGVDLDTFKGTTLQGSRTILSVGAFTKEKRHDLTIKAVAKLENIKLIIVGGGGELKQEIKMLGEKMLGDRFEILSVTYDKMPEIYRNAKMLAFPTVPWESFGIALVEAMATNLPVVATNDPIRREIVGDAGILVDPADTEAYAAALQKALDINWGDKPRKQAEKFSWDGIAEKYDELFKEITK